ncbi:MAG: hypothetical protein E6230_09010 [Paenibacillus dendritiformis]|uniref:hypothetical protein n=1 Tax=uncultured Paenibacillus sp. TaxID=227322 RepID=UPI0025FD6DF4|nr:hypothetical protein [uncultured Paenibacillus sp.]MDU5142312.1 hypothetical protein [Paenibacillus dendritiformis]
MRTTELIHELRQPKIQPWYWILMWEVYFVVVLVGLAMMIGPFLLLYGWRNGWVYASFLLAVPGFFIVRGTVRLWAQQLWMNRHRDTYRLYPERVEYKAWDPASRGKREGSIALADIRRVLYGYSVLEGYHLYKPSKFTEQVPQFGMVRTLTLEFSDGWKPGKLSVPMMRNDDILAWLAQFRSGHIPLYFSQAVYGLKGLFVVGQEQPLEEEGQECAEAAWPEDIHRIDCEFRQYVESLAPEEEEEPLPEGASASSNSQPQRTYRFGKIGWKAYGVLLLQGVLLYGILAAADQGYLTEEMYRHPAYKAIAAGIMLLFGFLFYQRVSIRHGMQLISYPLLNLALYLVGGAILCGDEGTPSYGAWDEIATAALLYIAISWIPYLIISRVRRNRAERQQAAHPGL